MMRIRTVSDLHLEFDENKDVSPIEDGEVLVIAGDVAPWNTHKELYVDFVTRVGKEFRQVVLVAGNHEFYHGEYNLVTEDMAKTLLTIKGVRFLHNGFHIMDEATFIGCTLWTSFNGRNPLLMCQAQNALNDFKYINFAGSPITADKMWDLHTIARGCLSMNMRQFKDHNTVVVTHYAPTMYHTHGVVRDLDYMFASPMEYDIFTNAPKLWIHGHVHRILDYEVETTRVVCNPIGYPGEKTGYDQNLAIEV